MFNNFRVSIIIPVYNAEKYLVRCLQSIIAQTYQNLEIILINDGSTDGSGIICDQYASNFSYIKVFHQYNQGAATARNVGILQASGDFLSFIDSDDTVEPDFYEVMVAIMKKENPDWICWNEKSRYNLAISGMNVGKQYQKLVLNLIAGKGIGNALWSQFYKRSIFNKYHIILPTHLRNFEDKAGVLQYALVAKNLYYIPGHSFYHYMYNPVSITHTYNPNLLKCVVNEIIYFEDLLSNNALIGYQPYLKEWIAFQLYRVYLEEHSASSPNTFKQKQQKIKEFFESSVISCHLRNISYSTMTFYQFIVLKLSQKGFYKLAYMCVSLYQFIRRLRNYFLKN